MIAWEKLTKKDVQKASKVVDRLLPMAEEYGIERGRREWQMDIEAACIANNLNLDRLLTFPDFDFAHDVFGILNHIDRNTGEFMDCFWPRCGSRPLIG